VISTVTALKVRDILRELFTMETLDSESEFVPPQNEATEESSSWNLPEINPWLLLLLGIAAYYVYQNYLSNLKLPSREAAPTPHDEEKVRQMMEIRSRQQEQHDSAAKELEEKRKSEPPPKMGPISKSIAAKAKLRPGNNQYKFVHNLHPKIGVPHSPKSGCPVRPPIVLKSGSPIRAPITQNLSVGSGHPPYSLYPLVPKSGPYPPYPH
jgi:hypothetical protein